MSTRLRSLSGVWWTLPLPMTGRCYILSLRFNGHFPGETGLAGVYWSKGWWRWWWQLDYWSYKSCKAPVKSSPLTNQHPVFLQAGCPSCHPTNSVKARREADVTLHRDNVSRLTLLVQFLFVTPGCSLPLVLLSPQHLELSLQVFLTQLSPTYHDQLHYSTILFTDMHTQLGLQLINGMIY